MELRQTAWLLPKDLLNSIRSAQWLLADSAEHLADPKFLREQAAFPGRAFDSLLSGGSMSARRSGVSRIS